MVAVDINGFYNIKALYHMTHIDNFDAIFRNGLLPHGNRYQSQDISDKQVNSLRNREEPIYGKAIHSYVPFYINPKNAMLYKRKEMQNEIVILEFSKELLFTTNSIFTDGNASSRNTNFFNNIQDLDRLDWSCLNDNSWYNHVDGRRRRMAEVLVRDSVGVDSLSRVICNNMATFNRLKQIVGNRVEIVLDCSFYF